MAERLIYRAREDDNVASDPIELLDGDAQARAVAEYLGDMLDQLETMARVSGFELLSYLLGMARVEAQINARLGKDSRSAAGR